MSSFRAPWALCGGWAVDAWLGRQSRDHGDIDVSVFADDQRTLFEHLPGWQLLAHDPDRPAGNGEWWDGRRHLNAPAHIHSRPPELSGAIPKDGIATAEDGFTLEFQINLREGDEWVLSREPRMTMPLQRTVRQSDWGLPTLVPEAVLFYKATAYFGVEEFKDRRAQDEPDFVALLASLTKRQRDWLREAISLVHPDHPWLAQLST